MPPCKLVVLLFKLTWVVCKLNPWEPMFKLAVRKRSVFREKLTFCCNSAWCDCQSNQYERWYGFLDECQFYECANCWRKRYSVSLAKSNLLSCCSFCPSSSSSFENVGTNSYSQGSSSAVSATQTQDTNSRQNCRWKLVSRLFAVNFGGMAMSGSVTTTTSSSQSQSSSFSMSGMWWCNKKNPRSSFKCIFVIGFVRYLWSLLPYWVVGPFKDCLVRNSFVF